MGVVGKVLILLYKLWVFYFVAASCRMMAKMPGCSWEVRQGSMAKRRSVGLVVVLFVNKTTIKERAFRRGKEGALGATYHHGIFGKEKEGGEGE